MKKWYATLRATKSTVVWIVPCRKFSELLVKYNLVDTAKDFALTQFKMVKNTIEFVKIRRAQLRKQTPYVQQRQTKTHRGMQHLHFLHTKRKLQTTNSVESLPGSPTNPRATFSGVMGVGILQSLRSKFIPRYNSADAIISPGNAANADAEVLGK